MRPSSSDAQGCSLEAGRETIAKGTRLCVLGDRFDTLMNSRSDAFYKTCICKVLTGGQDTAWSLR